MSKLVTVQVQDGSSLAEVQITKNATVFHLAVEAQKALAMKEFPTLCRSDCELHLGPVLLHVLEELLGAREHDSSLEERLDVAFGR